MEQTDRGAFTTGRVGLTALASLTVASLKRVVTDPLHLLPVRLHLLPVRLAALVEIQKRLNFGRAALVSSRQSGRAP
jgi:hypothetical protein